MNDANRDKLGRYKDSSKGHLSHGHACKGSRSKEYRTWLSIKGRCHRKTDGGYKDYGHRGISVCKEWRESFERFLAHIGPAPSEEYQIDRINCYGNYEPGNVRWVDYITQMNNTRRSVRIHLRHKSFTVKEVCERYGIQRELLKAYIQRQKKKGLEPTYTEAFFYVCLKLGIKPCY